MENTWIIFNGEKGVNEFFDETKNKNKKHRSNEALVPFKTKVDNNKYEDFSGVVGAFSQIMSGTNVKKKFDLEAIKNKIHEKMEDCTNEDFEILFQIIENMYFEEGKLLPVNVKALNYIEFNISQRQVAEYLYGIFIHSTNLETMILNAIKKRHCGEIDIIEPCELSIESFSQFQNVLEKGFDSEFYTKEVIESDKLKQLYNYEELWRFITGAEEIQNKRKAKNFLENLGESTFNLIINEAENVGEGIRYFIDVNLKGKQLDTEDIFKSYLFKNDSGQEIRKQWYLLKSTVKEIEISKMDYPLLKLLEHYLLCDLYRNDRYRGMEFGTDFLLKKPFKENDITHRAGTHLIELIDDNQYMRRILERLNEVSHLMLIIVKSDSLTEEIKKVFMHADKKEQIDIIELKVIHNIIGKILKDSKILPKALLIKYFNILLYGDDGKKKINIQKIYGIYMFTVLFTIFENKKSTEVLLHIIKANEEDWYKELVNQINNYFSNDKITDARLLAQYKLGQNEEEENQRFRCKSLATIYNFFVNQNGKVSIRKGKMNDLYKFITDDEAFSIEHFIISETRNGSVAERRSGTPQGGVISPVLANLFLHYVFDDFMTKAYPNIWWERYADDGVLHCQSYKQAAFIKQKLEERFQQFGLELNKEKTRIVYCKDNRRPQNYSCTQFTFLGYTFRPRLNKNKEGKFFVGFTPAVSEKAKTAMKQKIREWKIQLKADLSLKDIGNMINKVVQGWINYYTHYYKSEFYEVLRYINQCLIKWVRRSYKKKNTRSRAEHWLGAVARRDRNLFAHWKFGILPSVGEGAV